ncbi:MAG: hypothetical protein H6667_14650 [Ardenticatenaceae bacterium]|nr:hypothetical protein [Ardenticatenaceae bacterium]
MNTLFAFIIIVVVALLILTRRQRNGRSLGIRPLSACNSLSNQVGEAIESGRQLQVSLGQGSLVGAANPASVAAIHILDHLAKDGCASSTPPLTTVGDGTLLPIAQDSLRQAHEAAGRLNEYKPSMTQFLAANSDPYAYAGGIATILQQGKTSSNLLVGRFGPELAIPAEIAARKNMEQVIGTDDPSALAVATAVTDNVLVGEELFAASAYLENKPGQIASLKVQDIMRWLVIITILLLALSQVLAG